MLLRRWTVVVGAVLALVVSSAACGDDDSPAVAASISTAAPPDTGAATSTTVVPEETTSVPAAPAPVQELAVTASDYAYDLGGPPPTLAPGLVRVELTNTGAEEHQATLIRLNDGVTLADFIAGASADPTGVAALQLARGYAGPNSAAPGGGTSTTVQAVVPGDYLMICFIPSADGVPHAAKGMALPFTVAGDAAADEPSLPDAEVDAEVSLVDYAFEGAASLPASGTISVHNDGDQAHELALYALADGATVDDVVAFLADPAAAGGPPPFAPAGGIAALLPGGTAYVELDLSPGAYVAVCFLPDSAGQGAPHFTLGMATQVELT